MIYVIKYTKNKKLHCQNCRKHENLMPMEHILVFAGLQNFTHDTVLKYTFAHTPVYIYVILCFVSHRMSCLTPRFWVAATLTFVLAGGHAGVLANASVVTCMASDAPVVKQIFSIDVYKIINHPLIPIVRKKICISDAPHVDINIGVQAFNLLNATASYAACRDMYSRLVCANIKPVIEDACQYANQIMFAAVESIVQCETDADCQGVRSRYDMPPLWCEWSLEMSKHVCETPFNERLMNTCEMDADKATRIRGACVFTNAFCAYVVQNVHFLAPLSGITLFVTSFFVIYITHPANASPRTG